MTVVIGSGEDQGPEMSAAIDEGVEDQEVKDEGTEDMDAGDGLDPADCSFPEEELKKLEEMINRSRWVVPVLPNGELELLLRAALRLAKNGTDEDNELCKRFVKEGLMTSFLKILTDEAVSGWKFEIHKCIYNNCELLIELCVVKLKDNCGPLLEMLALVFNPENKFHSFNASRGMDYPSQDQLYAKSVDARAPKGWLVNLINKFGAHGGFEMLEKRFEQTTAENPLPLSLIVALVRPFGQCCQYLLKTSVIKYLMPIVEKVPEYLQNLSDEQLKKDTKNDSLSLLVKWLRCIASCAGQTQTVEQLEEFRLQMLLKLLQISSFNGKMNALNEVNKAITSVMLYRQSGHGVRCASEASDVEYLNCPKMVNWIRENNVLSIVLRDSLHQPQYVEKLEKILRFMIKERALGVTDLDAIWEAQSGATRHEAIVKNIHDLLAKLAWDFSPEQLEHVFESCFKKSWATASTKKEREKLIELIRRLAEDDKDGMMAHKVLELLWGLAHNNQVPNEIVDLALAAHLKILDYSCCQDRSAQKSLWLEQCVEELKTNDRWVIPALKHIRDICMLYQEAQSTQHGVARGANSGPSRSDVISTLQNQHTLVVLVTHNLVEYVQESKKYVGAHPDPNLARDGHRYSHKVNVNERLNFMRFLLKDGQLWLCAPQATQIWKCLAENGAYGSDREACFKWFAKLMGDEPDLDPDINKQFFEDNILKFDPSHLTDSGIRCFERFFKMVNLKEGNLVTPKNLTSSNSNTLLIDNVELIGYDYLWKVVLLASDEVSARATEILRSTYTNLGPKLQSARMELHEEFVSTCYQRIRVAFDTMKCLQASERAAELRKMKRVLRLLTQYVQQCDGDCTERMLLPMHRALRGKEMKIMVQVSNANNDEILVGSHANEMLYNFKRIIEQKFDSKLDLYLNEEPIADKLFHCMGAVLQGTKGTLKAKPALNSSTSIALPASSGAHQSSPVSTSSSESESPSPPQLSHTSQLLMESQLPGVIISRKEERVKFSLHLCDIPELHDVTWELLQQIPASCDVIRQIQVLCAEESAALASYMTGTKSLSELQYNLEVLYALLLPANNPLAADTLLFQCHCIRSGILHTLSNRLLEAGDLPHSVYLILLKLYRFLLSILIRKRTPEVDCTRPRDDSLMAKIAKRIVDEFELRDWKCEDLPTNTIEAILGTLVNSSWEITNYQAISCDDVHMCQESLYALTASLLLLNNQSITSNVLQNSEYIFYLLLRCPEAAIRQAAEDTFYDIATQFYPLHFIKSLYARINDELITYNEQSSEYFSLIGRLLKSLRRFDEAVALFEGELVWLREARVVKRPPLLLEGHLIIADNLCLFLSWMEKEKHQQFVKELLEDFVFPASKTFVALKENARIDPSASHASSVCTTNAITNAALNLVVQLCDNSPNNLREARDILNHMFYSEKNVRINEWEYLPAVGPRPNKGFVGLKNAGATCYMNSVLQQLYMIKPIRRGLQSLENVVTERDLVASCFEDDYNLGVLKQVMIIFGFLEKSRQQFYVPSGFWNHFRLWGEPVNVREQHDALEFFNSLVDSIDEALKALKRPPILNKILGGTFADQKICKGCPHRYSREESFTTLNIDIRNHSNLLDSLEQYVKGDLLEGANAYHCEQCSKKVDTVKRLCIKSLPQILAIQLKRFDYDWERECAIKFNDYFEFPRKLDMEPYTVQGLARREGESVEADRFEQKVERTVYELSGIVVHSGQASGGHYYSYIKTEGQWYKFDDGEVCESKMDAEDEMRNQCFGGDYVSEMFDHISKRMSCRRQKRWWNAYILFYERVDRTDIISQMDQLKLQETDTKLASAAIEMSVWQQNLQYTHLHDQFTPEFFQFFKKLVAVNSRHLLNNGDASLPANSPGTSSTADSAKSGKSKQNPLSKQLAVLSLRLAKNFLFNTYFHTKKGLRGNMTDWLNTLVEYFRCSKDARTWFARSITSDPHTICTYLLECPVDEVRHFFAQLLASLCHCLLKDVNQSAEDSERNYLAQEILSGVMSLLLKDVCEYGRNLNHYFLFYALYCQLGNAEKRHLIKNDVPLAFIRVALDDGPGPAIKYQYAELSKLFQTIATLVRCLDVTPYQNACGDNEPVLPNPFAKDTLAPMPQSIADYLFHQSTFTKKILEDANSMEEVVDLLKYLCWENQAMSVIVITELLWFIAYVCTYEMRPFLDVLLHILKIEDSWQKMRINKALKGFPQDRDGLFDTIERSKNHYQKRAYQCIKFMVELFLSVPDALNENGETQRKFHNAVEWLRSELERRQYPTAAWSQVSNETSNGYFLERSTSSLETVTKAGILLTSESEEVTAPTDVKGEEQVPESGAPEKAMLKQPPPS